MIAALLALYGGFFAFSPEQCVRLVRAVGYWWMLGLTAGLIVAAMLTVSCCGGWRLCARQLWPGRNHALLILLCALWLNLMDRPGYKIFFDEPVQVSTSFLLHYQRELDTPTRAYPLNSLFSVVSAYLDKRPPYFPFLVSLMHDLTGYRTVNAIAVNMAATFLLVWAVWLLGRYYGGSATAGACAIGLMATLPELGVCATGAGMDLVNLLFLVFAWGAAVIYYERPAMPTAALLVFSALILAYCRYESVLYVGAAALAGLLVLLREKRRIIEPVWALLPLGLMFYAWHNKVLSSSPELWELRAEQTQRFSLAYASNNLAHAWQFLLSADRRFPNSLLLTLAGLGGAFWLGWRLWRSRDAKGRYGATLAPFLMAIMGNFGLLMCYYWGELDDPTVTRLSLPLHLLFALLAIAGWRELQSIRPTLSWRMPGWVTVAALLIFTIPAIATASYTQKNLMRKNVEWERRVITGLYPQPDLVITNRSPLCWLPEGMPSITVDRAIFRAAQLRWHMQRHTFNNVVISQRVLTLGAQGGWEVDDTDALPQGWKLEEIAVRRIGRTLTRISRVIELPETTNELAPEGPAKSVKPPPKRSPAFLP